MNLRNCMTTTKVLEKRSPEALTELRQALATMKVEYFKHQGVKTPVELVKAMAELETNMFGSKMKFWGDEKQASVEYEVCGCYNAMKDVLKLNETEQETMGKVWATMIEVMAKEFGFKGETKFGTCSTEAPCTITFTK